jgi:hypothetical protein
MVLDSESEINLNARPRARTRAGARDRQRRDRGEAGGGEIVVAAALLIAAHTFGADYAGPPRRIGKRREVLRGGDGGDGGAVREHGAAEKMRRRDIFGLCGRSVVRRVLINPPKTPSCRPSRARFLLMPSSARVGLSTWVFEKPKSVRFPWASPQSCRHWRTARRREPWRRAPHGRRGRGARANNRRSRISTLYYKVDPSPSLIFDRRHACPKRRRARAIAVHLVD